MNTKIYIDGFNFYYGCLKGTPYKWLDLHHLFINQILPTKGSSNICLLEQGIQFYTADISHKAAKTSSSVADQTSYLRALCAQSQTIKIIKGDYLIKQSRAYRIEQNTDNNVKHPRESQIIDVWKIEEKQSDVNLAIDIVTDALTIPDLKHIVVVTNDTDILPAIKRVKELTDISIGVVLPILKEGRVRRINRALTAQADWSRDSITSDELARSQLTRVVKTGGRKDAIKPISWFGQPQIVEEIINTLLPTFKSKRNQCWRWLEQNREQVTNKPFITLLDDEQSALAVLERAKTFVLLAPLTSA